MPAVSVFLSYARKDDDATYGRITKLKNDIRLSYEALSGESVGVFQDTDSIPLGERWQEILQAGLMSSSVFVAFVSPAYLRSINCREELREFLSAVGEGRGRRLIIPLVFADRAQLRDEFGSDETWQEIDKLQGLDVEDLRRADPGSSLWLENVEKVTKRIREVLLKVRAEELRDDGSSSVTAKPTPEAAGTMEIFARMEAGVPALQHVSQQFGSLFERLTSAMQAETANMGRAETFGQRLAITGRLADSLQPIAAEAESLAGSFRDETAALDAAAREAVRLVRSGVMRLDDPDTRDGIEAMRRLAADGLESLAPVDELTSLIEGVLGVSGKLDPPLRRLNGAFLVFAELRGQFRTWLNEIDSLQQPDLTGGSARLPSTRSHMDQAPASSSS